MISRLVEISEKLADDRKHDPAIRARMDLALRGQFPRFLLISPINRSSQDLQLFNLKLGEAFHATRVPGHALLSPEQSLTLFKGPASYNHEFQSKRGVVLTFDAIESLDVVRETIESVRLHPHLRDLPILAFHVDYERGRARLIVHGKGRDYANENSLLSKLRRPDELDSDLLVFLCCDSRIRPPRTSKGSPMAIRTLGGYIPAFSGNDDETRQLNEFFSDWLSAKQESKRVLIVAHGDFEGGGASCGAGTASLHLGAIENPLLREVIEELENAASQYETVSPNTPEERVKAISKASHASLLTYPSIAEAHKVHQLTIDEILMDTITNTLVQSDES
jgi:hypothetical protein